MEFVNCEGQLIFEHVAHRYPQSGVQGTSRRIKNYVQKIDNRESVDYDFLLSHNISITYREDGDYSMEIMQVLNKLIGFSGEFFNKKKGEHSTNY